MSKNTKKNNLTFTKNIFLKIKAELHLHLDGSVRPLTVIELAKEQGVELPTFDEDELKQVNMFYNWFVLTSNFLKKKQNENKTNKKVDMCSNGL